MSIVTIEGLSAEGVVLINNQYHSGWGVAADIAKKLQALLPNLAEAKSLGELTFNAKLRHHPLELMMGLVEDTPMFTTEFTQYSLGFCKYEGEEVEFALHVADYEGDRYIAFGPLAESVDFTADKCPEGGLGVQAIPLTEWDAFVEEFAAVEFPAE